MSNVLKKPKHSKVAPTPLSTQDKKSDGSRKLSELQAQGPFLSKRDAQDILQKRSSFDRALPEE